MSTGAATEVHIASLVVHAAPRRRADIAGSVAALPGAVVHAVADNGKLIVTLESATAEDMSAQVSRIQRLDGVLCAALVYQCNDSVEAMNEEMPGA